MKYLTSLIIFTVFLFGRTNAQEVSFPVKNYTTKEYGKDFHPSNMSVVQDQRGIIYAANSFKLLEYDGHTWNSYPINKETFILSLAVDNAGIIYAGSQNEFGFFAPDLRGKLKYCSLSDSLKNSDSDFSNIWKVLAFSGGVVFQAEEKLFLFKNRKTEIIKPKTSFHTSFIVNDILYVRQREIGLMELKKEGLVRIEGSEIFDTTGVFLMVPFGRNSKKILIGTQEKGFWLFDPGKSSGRFSQFKVNDLDLIEKAKISGGALTGGGLIAISTRLNGLIVIDTTGATIAVINKRNGLSDNEINQVISDQSQNLWLATNNGISTVEISSPLSVFTEKSGITGSIYTLNRYKNLLYAGTNSGLLVQKPENNSEVQFEPAFNFSLPVRSLINVSENLMAGTDAGIYQISSHSFQKVSEEGSWVLYYSQKMKLLFSGGQKGVTVFINNGSLRKPDNFNDIHGDVIGITGENEDSGDSAVFWIGTRYNGVKRIKVYKNLNFISDDYSSTDGLPSGSVTPFRFNSKTVFGTIDGLYEFIDEKTVRETLPDSLKDNKDFLKGYFSALPLCVEVNGKSITSVIESSDKVWICSDNKLGFLMKKNNLSYISQPLRGIDMGKILTIYPEENGICWIGTSDGLVRYNENALKNYKAPYFSLIRKVTLIDNDSVIFMGTNFKTDSGELKIIHDQPVGQKPILNFRNNSIRFEFTAPFYEYPEKIFYSYQLEGNGSKSTQWTRENYQEYTNLKEGDYTFNLKARNVYGSESRVVQYNFKVLPPWYRSILAYVFYSIFTVFLIWLIVRIYSYRLKRENIRLEGIVVERTSEVVRQKDEIENKNIVLEYQKKEIEDSIRYARRIQSAVIPSEKDCTDLLPESFVFFRPLNIVSGDFYWIGKVEDKIIFTAADCTGHGVPGAIMSMLGVAFLNEIVNEDHITQPDEILNNLRSKVIQALQQQGISGEARDGMDIAMVSIDEKKKKIQFAGAYNPLIMIRNGEIFMTAGDKMPIGIYEKMNPFTRYDIDLENGDVIYMASDGYEDQFGGPEGKKFKATRFRQLLLEIHKYPMKSQKEIIEKRFEEWKGDLSQIDDVVVIGIALK